MTGVSVKFDYAGREVDPLPGEAGLQLIHEPIITIRVVGPERTYLVRGLIDTGASMTIVPRSYFAKLGFAKGEPASLATAGGPVGVLLNTVNFELIYGTFSARWSARVGFAPRADNTALLGHAGFLRYFVATFNGRKKTVSLARTGSMPMPVDF